MRKADCNERNPRVASLLLNPSILSYFRELSSLSCKHSFESMGVNNSEFLCLGSCLGKGVNTSSIKEGLKYAH